MHKDDSTAKSCQYSFNDGTRDIGYDYFEYQCKDNSGYAPGSGTSKINSCDKIYVKLSDEVENKYLYDRWVTTLIFACFIIACNIGLAIFGFFLFKSDTPGI